MLTYLCNKSSEEKTLVANRHSCFGKDHQRRCFETNFIMFEQKMRGNLSPKASIKTYYCIIVYI